MRLLHHVYCMIETLLGAIYLWIWQQLYRFGQLCWRFYRLADWKRRYIVWSTACKFSNEVCKLGAERLEKGEISLESAEQYLRMADWAREKVRPIENQVREDLERLTSRAVVSK